MLAGLMIPLILDEKKTSATNQTISVHESNRHFTINRDCDSLKIVALVVPKIYLESITKFEINFNGNKIWSIPITILLTHFSVVKDTECYITFPNDVFGINIDGIQPSYIPLVCLMYTRIQFVLTAKENFEYSIILDKRMYKTELRKEFIKPSLKSYKINQYMQSDINSHTTRIKPIMSLSDVYIILTDEIAFYYLNLNSTTYQSLSQTLIKYNECLISKKKLWTNEHFKLLKQSLTCSIDIINMIQNYVDDKKYKYVYKFPNADLAFKNSINRLDVDIRIITKSGKYEGIIYYKTSNELLIADGTAGLRFDN